MKKIELASMTIQNFKGIENFELQANRETLKVFGDNKTGKTSLYDALLWCLFHKDSKDRDQFNWKPLDVNNKPVHHLNTNVTLVLNVDGKQVEYSKTKYEKWSTKRGTTQKYFKDETIYSIDGLELSTKKLYDEKVAELLDQETFKYLTSVTYFNEVLSPEERREILFKYFGSKTDKEIIEENKELLPLLPIIGNDTTKDAREKIMQRKKALAESIKKIPIKMEGIQEALPNISGVDQSVLLNQKQELIIAKDKAEKDLMAIKNGGAMAEKQATLRALHSELKEEESNHQLRQNAKINGIEDGKNKLFAKVNEANNQVLEEESRRAAIERELDSNKKYLERLNQERQGLIKEWDEKSAVDCDRNIQYKRQTFDEHQLRCPLCQAEYTEDKKAEIQANHEAEEDRKEQAYITKRTAEIQRFDEDKATKLAQITQRGQEVNKEIDLLEEQILEQKNLLAENSIIEELIRVRDDLKTEYESVISTIEALQSKVVPFSDTQKYQEIMEKVAELEADILQLSTSLEEQIAVKEKAIYQVKQELQIIEEQLAVWVEYNRQQSVIEKLGQEERTLSEEKGEVESQLVLFDEFFIKKVSLLESNVNAHFKMITFKLFDFYEEGGLNESVCEPVVEGVPFRDLNNADRINSGLDVANTLMIQEGIKVPLFVDNAEAVTNLLEIDTQVIALYVSEEDKTLRVNEMEDVA